MYVYPNSTEKYMFDILPSNIHSNNQNSPDSQRDHAKVNSGKISEKDRHRSTKTLLRNASVRETSSPLILKQLLEDHKGPLVISLSSSSMANRQYSKLLTVDTSVFKSNFSIRPNVDGSCFFSAVY